MHRKYNIEDIHNGDTILLYDIDTHDNLFGQGGNDVVQGMRKYLGGIHKVISTCEGDGRYRFFIDATRCNYLWNTKSIKKVIPANHIRYGDYTLSDLEVGDIVGFYTEDELIDKGYVDHDFSLSNRMIKYLGGVHEISNLGIGDYFNIITDNARWSWDYRIIKFLIKEDSDMSLDDKFTLEGVEQIKADGITVRVGNKLVKLEMTGEESLPEDDIRKEYEKKMILMKENAIKQMHSYHEQMKLALDTHRRDYEDKERDLKRRLKKVNNIPKLSEGHSKAGLSVVSHDRSTGHLVWYYKCVYQPKYINERTIEPGFAKRLMTPVQIQVKTDESGRIYDVLMIKIIGNDKFPHYHATGSSDCWGGFDYTSYSISTPKEMIDFCKKIQSLLETINSYSIGTDNPRGLSRLETLKRHLISDDDVPKKDIKKSTVNSRNRRSGFDHTINDGVSDGWTT